MSTKIIVATCVQILTFFQAIAQIPTAGRVAYYPFSGNANDESVNGKNGIVYGATLTTDRFGNANSAYYFDGVSDYIKVNNDTALNLRNFTYSIWVKMETIPQYGSGYSIFEIGSVPNDGTKYGEILGLSNGYTSKYGWSINSGNTDGSVTGFPTDTMPDAKKWYNLVITRSDSTVSFYINNKLRNIKSVFGLTPFYNNPLDIFIGTRCEFLHYFKGTIDDIMIYDHVLTNGEITCLFNAKPDSELLGDLRGNITLCKGSQNVKYNVNFLKNNLYSWSYSGNGATILGSSDTISINFSANATSGILKATAVGPDSSLQSKELLITVNSCSNGISEGLIAYYPFNGNANDATGNGNNGYVYGAIPTSDRFGKPNSAFAFNGINNYIKITNNLLKNSNNFTYSVWVNMPVIPPSGYCIYEIGATPYGQYGSTLSVTQSGYLQKSGWTVTNGNTDGSNQGFTTDSLPFTNVWYYLVLTRSDSTINLYVNNQKLATRSIGASIPYYGDPVDIYLGSRSELFGYLNGSLDDLMIYNRVLSDDELTSLYHNNPENQFLSEIIGSKQVFKCQESVSYKVLPLNNVAYDWSYSGSGAIISGTLDSISIFFADSATSGTLKVTVSGQNITTQTKELGIDVKPCPQGLAKGLVAYYPLNGNANDESGNGYNGIVYGATPTTDGYGNSNSAYSFNGMGNYISLPSITMAARNSYTYSLWVYPNQIPSYFAQIPFSAGDNNFGYDQALGYQPNGSFFSGSYNIGTNPVQSYLYSPIVQPNQWIHVVVTRDSSFIKEYINGMKVSYSSTSDINNQTANYGSGPTFVNIGGRSNLVSNYFLNGKVDEVRIYNRALSDSEAIALYNRDAGIQNSSNITGMNSVCQGQQDIGFKVTPLYGASYNWSFNGTGASIIGTFDSVSVNFANNASNGTIKVIVSCQNLPVWTKELPVTVNTCHFLNDTFHVNVYDTIKVVREISVTDTLIIDAQLTGIYPLSHNIIKAYPNPTRDRVIIDNGNYISMSGYRLKIINSTGTVVFESLINMQKFDLDLNTFGGNGTYFLQIIDNSSQVIEIKKIILL
jgi:hypothetical protein